VGQFDFRAIGIVTLELSQFRGEEPSAAAKKILHARIGDVQNDRGNARKSN